MSKSLTKEEEQALIQAAKDARENSYSPYSHFKVGAAVLTSDGKIFTGTNIENSSYGLTICAERSALFAAVGMGARKFRALALITQKTAGAKFNSPCGACRQVMGEFFSPSTPIYMAVINGKKVEVYKKTLKEILPFPFPKLAEE